MKARELIEAERQRQIDVEGWSRTHDDQHTDGSLYKAAYAYLAFDPSKHNPNIAPPEWPSSWDDMWWKPRTRQENLIRAGALCLAELERLKRAQKREFHGTPHPPWLSPSPRMKAVDETLICIISLLEDHLHG